MLPETIMQSDLLDILFEDRNKNYGAYTLRKNYNQRLLIAVIVVAIVTLIFSLLQQLNINSDGRNHLILHTNDSVYIVQLSNEQELPKPISHKNVLKPLKLIAQIKNVIPKIVSDNKVKDTTATIDDLKNKFISDKNLKGSPSLLQQGIALLSNENSSETVKEKLPVETSIPIEHPQVMPQFPGGIDAFQKFMHRNLKQPDDLNGEDKIIVLAKFVVETSGKISNIQIIQSGRKDLDEDVIHALQKMPEWIPGTQNGKSVSVYFSLPVSFVGNE